MRSSRTLLNLLLAVFLIAAVLPGATTVLAQDGGQTAPAQDTQSIDLSFADLGYTDVTLEGHYSSSSYSIGVPPAWEVQPGSVLELAIRHDFGTLAPSTDANGATYYAPLVSLQVNLNDVTIYREILPDTTDQVIPITLPDTWPKRLAGNTDVDRLEVFIRVNGPCETSLYNTLTIFSKSMLKLNYKLMPVKLDLAKYPSPFYQRSFLPNRIDIALDENVSPAQLSAAYSIAAGLGSLSRNRALLNTVFDTQWNAAASPDNLIIVGTPESNSLIAQLNQSADLPVKLLERKLALTTRGPDVMNPGAPATYTIRVENTDNVPAFGLTLRSGVLAQAAEYQCQPGCGSENGQAVWNVGSLEAGQSLEVALTVTPAASADVGNIYLNSELVQDAQPVNVSTLQAALRLSGEGAETTTQPVGKYLFAANGRAVSESAGVLAFVASPWAAGKAVLLVSGLNDEAVSKAGQAMGSSTRFPGMSGQLAVVQEILPPTQSNGPATVFSLADLGYADNLVTGLTVKDIFYTFDVPINWNLTDQASVTVDFSHSPMLYEKRSSITVMFNGNPIGSVALNAENANDGTLNVPLTARSARPGSLNTLLVRVETDFDDPCVDPETTQAWVNISATSSVNLAHSEGDPKDFIDLDYWPRPLITTANRDLADILISLPARPTAQEHALGMQIASFLGYSSSGTETFKPAVAMGEVDAVELANYNIIAVGRPTRSALVSAINDQLPQPFLPQSDNIAQQIDNVIFDITNQVDLGYVQLIISPWNADRVVVTATGTSDQGVAMASGLLSDADRARKMQGNLVLARGEDVLPTDTRAPAEMGLATAVPQATAAPTTLNDAAQAPAAGEATPTSVQPVVSGQQATTAPAQAASGSSPLLLTLVIAGAILAILATIGWAVWQTRKSS